MRILKHRTRFVTRIKRAQIQHENGTLIASFFSFTSLDRYIFSGQERHLSALRESRFCAMTYFPNLSFKRSLCQHSVYFCVLFYKDLKTLRFFVKYSPLQNTLNHKPIAEPIQHTPPRLELTDKLKLASVRLTDTTSILCPVQSYPTPSYRQFSLFFISNRFSKVRFGNPRYKTAYQICQHSEYPSVLIDMLQCTFSTFMYNIRQHFC